MAYVLLVSPLITSSQQKPFYLCGMNTRFAEVQKRKL